LHYFRLLSHFFISAPYQKTLIFAVQHILGDTLQALIMDFEQEGVLLSVCVLLFDAVVSDRREIHTVDLLADAADHLFPYWRRFLA